METRCPLCRAGVLEFVERELLYLETRLRAEAWQCVGCREIVLDAAQLERLRHAIRQEGLAEGEEQLEHVIERLLLQPG